MKLRNKKMLMGIVTGLVLTMGGIGYAAQDAAQDTERRQPPHHMGHRMEGQRPMQFDPSEMAKHMAKQFGVEESEVLAAINEKKDFRDIGHAAMIAKVSGKSFSEVLSMKQDGQHWRDVEQSLGVTHEQIRDYMGNLMAERMAESAKTDKATVEKLMKDGYLPHDIMFAGKIANASGKDIQSVLNRKKINNRWEDVAKELGVDESLLRPEHGMHAWGGPGFGPMGGPMGRPMGGPCGPDGAPPPVDEAE